MNSLGIVIFTFLIATIATGTSGAAYGRINDYLIKNVNDDEVAANMKAAIGWLKELSNSKPSLFERTPPINDLKKFTSLQQVIDSDKCDHAAYEILRANEEAVGLHKLHEHGQANRRVDKVMLKIFRDHAERCSPGYPVTYSDKKEQLDKTVYRDALGYVKNLATTLQEDIGTPSSKFRPRYLVNSANIFQRFVARIPIIQDFIGRNLLYQALLKNCQNDPDAKYVRKDPDEISGKPVVYEDKIIKLAQKYLIEPCRQFEAVFGPDLFIPARFDSQVYLKIDKENLDYYNNWSYFMLCRALTSNESVVFDNVIKFVRI